MCTDHEKGRVSYAIYRSADRTIGDQRDQQELDRSPRREIIIKERENHYTIGESRRGRSWGCQLRMKVDSSSNSEFSKSKVC